MIVSSAAALSPPRLVRTCTQASLWSALSKSARARCSEAADRDLRWGITGGVGAVIVCVPSPDSEVRIRAPAPTPRMDSDADQQVRMADCGLRERATGELLYAHR